MTQVAMPQCSYSNPDVIFSKSIRTNMPTSNETIGRACLLWAHNLIEVKITPCSALCKCTCINLIRCNSLSTHTIMDPHNLILMSLFHRPCVCQCKFSSKHVTESDKRSNEPSVFNLLSQVKACYITFRIVFAIIAITAVVHNIYMLEGDDEKVDYFEKTSNEFLLVHSSHWTCALK